MKLKRARLTDDLNEKIAQRPGPMELVEKNILPVDPGVEEVNNGRASLLLLYLFTTYSECSEGNSNQLCGTSGGFLSIFNDVLSLFGKQRPAVRKVSQFNYSSKTVIMLILISWPSLKKL